MHHQKIVTFFFHCYLQNKKKIFRESHNLCFIIKKLLKIKDSKFPENLKWQGRKFFPEKIHFLQMLLKNYIFLTRNRC